MGQVRFIGHHSCSCFAVSRLIPYQLPRQRNLNAIATVDILSAMQQKKRGKQTIMADNRAATILMKPESSFFTSLSILGNHDSFAPLALALCYSSL